MLGLAKRALYWARPKEDAAPVELSLAHLDHFGFWLDFDPAVAARYEADTGVDRLAHLRSAIIIGLVFYNAYDITDLVLLRDLGALGAIVRALVITPLSLGTYWLLTLMSARMRELSMTICMICALAAPIILLRLSSDPMSLYTLAELPLGVVFGGLMIVLRFPAACVFLAATLLMALAGVLTRTDISAMLMFVFAFQIFTAVAFVLVGNYKIEKERRRSYLFALREQLRSDLLEKDRQALAVLSNLDPLTGVGNRRFFDDMFAVKLQKPEPLALLMIDVDYFKPFNDTYGHPMGDSCLALVAAALSADLRSGHDVIARYGGEEFVVILTGCTLDSAQEIADRLRARVEAAQVPHASRADGFDVVTVSIGGVLVPGGETRPPRAMLEYADAALYEAKHRGRNILVFRTLDAADAIMANTEAA